MQALSLLTKMQAFLLLTKTQALFLLYEALSNVFTSFFLSLLLPLRHLIRCFSSTVWAGLDAVPDSVTLYEGTVWHEHRHPIHEVFKLSVRYALIDLDRTPNAPPNHLSADEARKAAETTGPVFLLVIPPSVGYQRSPVTLYYCYDLEGSTKILKRCIAEFSNEPWVEKVLFSFDPKGETVAKTLHISTFMDMLGNWKIKTSTPGNTLLVQMAVDHPELGKFFSASLSAKRVSPSWAVDYALFFWLMPHKTAIMTYWQGFKLRWKNVPFYEHPKYTNPGYREECLLREAKLQGCQFSRAFFPNQQFEETSPSYMPTTKVNGRWFTWREANWFWR